MKKPTRLAEFQKMGERFLGVDLQCRNQGVDWPHKWRASLKASKNERHKYRITAYADSPHEAIDRLLGEVERQKS